MKNTLLLFASALGVLFGATHRPLVVEHWQVLILVPVVAGALMFSLFFAWVRRYQLVVSFTGGLLRSLGGVFPGMGQSLLAMVVLAGLLAVAVAVSFGMLGLLCAPWIVPRTDDTWVVGLFEVFGWLLAAAN